MYSDHGNKSKLYNCDFLFSINWTQSQTIIYIYFVKHMHISEYKIVSYFLWLIYFLLNKLIFWKHYLWPSPIIFKIAFTDFSDFQILFLSSLYCFNRIYLSVIMIVNFGGKKCSSMGGDIKECRNILFYIFLYILLTAFSSPWMQKWVVL